MNKLISLNTDGKKVLVAVSSIAYITQDADWKGSPTTGSKIYFIGGNAMAAYYLTIDESLEEVERMINNSRD